MNKLFSLVLVVCFFSISTYAQLLPPDQPEQDACHALEICGNTFTSSFSYQGIGQVSDLTNTPCFGGEGNVMWFRMNIVTGGIIVFTISPLNQTDDYDFAVVDITNKTCSTFTQSDVIRCNFNNNWPGSNVNGVVGLNTTSANQFTIAGATGGSFLQQINANPGDVYLIMINNFGDPFLGGPSTGFTIDFTGTTATFNGPTPAMTSIIPSCNNASQITLQMNHNILCNTIAANGSDFTVAGGTVASATGINCSGTNGYTDKIVINFASPLPPGNYNLVAQQGADGNTLLNTCNIPLPVNSSIPFTVEPYEAPAFVSVEQPACTEFRVKLNKKVSCASIAKNGSDFSVNGPQASSVIAAYGVGCDTANFTDTVVLLLQTPLQTDGNYSFVAKQGSDNNTLLDSCGIAQVIGNSLALSINTWDGNLAATADTVLCEDQYFLLDVVNNAPLPPASVICGTDNSNCSGNFRGAFIGGKDSLSTTNSPFFGGTADHRAQYLFLASELREMGLKPGIISSLEWKIGQVFSFQPYANFTIKIGCTPLNNLTTAFFNSTQTVYNTPLQNVTTGWNKFTLTTPFNWDGTSNLIVETCFDNTTTSATDEVVHSITPFTSVLRRSTSGISGCSITTQGVLGSFRNLRPKIRFSICEPAPGPAIYAWTPGTLLSDPTLQQPLAYVDDDITYEVAFADKYGCLHRDTTRIIISVRNPSVYPVDTTICFGDKMLLKASGGIAYQWMANDESSLSCLTCNAPIVMPKQTTTYYVKISDQYNCADTLASLVRVNQLPLVDIEEKDMRVKYGSKITLTGSGAYLYNWSPSGFLSNPYVNNPGATITQPVTIYLTGIDQNGCRNVDSIKIDVDYRDPVFIPTAFSPNGDGRNDIFRVGSSSFQKLNEFRVFNRWGQEVYNTSDITKGWDGTFKGTPQDPGVYHYIVRLAYPDGKVETYKGDVTLLR